MDVFIQNENLWLTQKSMLMLFNFAKSIFREHLTNIFKTEELNRDTTIREYHYDKNSSVTKNFYATVHKKFHFAITGKTAAEIISKYTTAKGTKEIEKKSFS